MGLMDDLLKGIEDTQEVENQDTTSDKEEGNSTQEPSKKPENDDDTGDWYSDEFKAYAK